MSGPVDEQEILRGIREQVEGGRFLASRHAVTEMGDEQISLAEVKEVLLGPDSAVLENYPTHRRGACCLVGGKTEADRHFHVVCTSDAEPLIIITVYVPLPPKWVTPTQRGRR